MWPQQDLHRKQCISSTPTPSKFKEHTRIIDIISVIMNTKGQHRSLKTIIMETGNCMINKSANCLEIWLANYADIGINISVNSLPACDNFCRLLITFANSLDPYQFRHFVGPDLNPKLFVTLMVFLIFLCEKVDFEIKQQTTKNHATLPSMPREKPGL